MKAILVVASVFLVMLVGVECVPVRARMELSELVKERFGFWGKGDEERVMDVKSKGNVGWSAANRKLDPIVVVPGLTSSTLEARYNDLNPPHKYCVQNSKGKWLPLWPASKEQYLPGIIDCFVHHFTLQYDEKNNLYHNTTGVDIRPQDYGALNNTAYLGFFAKQFEQVGYVEGETLFGASYDWRPDGHGYSTDNQYYNLLKLVEKVYFLNNGTKVHIAGHSFGSPFAYYFLAKYAPQPWKDKYIASFISLSGPFLGTSVASVALATPLVFQQLPSYARSKMHNMFSTFASVVSLMPPELLWPADSIIIQTPTKNYTAKMAIELLQIANSSVPIAIRQNNVKDYNYLPPPGVTTHCLYGYAVDTPNTFVFADDALNEWKTYYNVSGDGSIALPSLEYCAQWVGKQNPYEVWVKPYFNATHNGLIANEEVFQYLLNVTTHPL